MVEKFFLIFKWKEIHKEYISERVVIKDVCLVSYRVKIGWKAKNSWINYSVAIKKWDTITQWTEPSLATQNSKTNFAGIMLKPGTIKHTLYYYLCKLKHSFTNLQW